MAGDWRLRGLQAWPGPYPSIVTVGSHAGPPPCGNTSQRRPVTAQHAHAGDGVCPALLRPLPRVVVRTPRLGPSHPSTRRPGGDNSQHQPTPFRHSRRSAPTEQLPSGFNRPYRIRRRCCHTVTTRSFRPLPFQTRGIVLPPSLQTVTITTGPAQRKPEAERDRQRRKRPRRRTSRSSSFATKTQTYTLPKTLLSAEA